MQVHHASCVSDYLGTWLQNPYLGFYDIFKGALSWFSVFSKDRSLYGDLREMSESFAQEQMKIP